MLAVLFGRYADLVFGVCLKYFKEPETSRDACSDIYAELVQKLLKYEVDNFKGWLHTLTKNHCLMKLRSGKKHQTVELPEYFMQSEDGLHLDGVIEKEKHLQQMEMCIETLSGDQKQAVTLFYLQEKCYNEITEMTGMTWNTVRSHIQNGRRNLKICMEKHGIVHGTY